MDVAQLIVAVAAGVSSAAGLGGFLLSRRGASQAAARTASTVAAEVTDAALHALQRAMEEQGATIRRQSASIVDLTEKVDVLAGAVERCEAEKRDLAVRVRELEAAA